MTTVHHLNCCTMHPVAGERVIHGKGSWRGQACLIAHCLLIETNSGLVLVDSGIGTRDIAEPERLGRTFLNMARPTLEPREVAFNQIQALGYSPNDVRHIVLTHMDVDHAGGISDFPAAKIHLYKAEYDAAMKPGWRERDRYRACHWEHHPNWVLHKTEGDRFMGMESVRAIVEPEVLLVPTIGHSAGHAAVAVKTPNGWLVHCGDAYFHHGEVEQNPHCPLGLRAFQRLVSLDNAKRLHNQIRLRQLRSAHSNEVRVFCAHDRDEMTRFMN